MKSVKSHRKSRKNKPCKSLRKSRKTKSCKSLRKSRKRSKSLKRKKILKGGMEKDTDPYEPLPKRNSKRQERIALNRLSNVFGGLNIGSSIRPSTKPSIEKISTSISKLGLEDDTRPSKK